MNQYVTGAVIKELREKYHFTQAELAKKLNVSANVMSSKFYVCPSLDLLQTRQLLLTSSTLETE